MAFDIATEYTLPAVLNQNARDGSFMDAIDVLSGKFPILEEGMWLPANEETSHEFIRTTSEPTGSLTRLNEGVAFEATSEVPVRVQLARLESLLKIDSRVLEKSFDPVKFRIEKEQATVRGMVKTFHKMLFSTRETASLPYSGDPDIDPKSISGLRKLYNTLTTTASAVDNVRGLGGTTANVQSSIWLIKHGPDGLFFLHPRTSANTLQVRDLGELPAYDSNSKQYMAVETSFAWEFGWGIGDERCIQRLANVATAQTGGSFGKDTDVAQGEEAMIDMIERLPSGDPTNAAFYVGPTLITAIRKRLNSKSNLYFTMENVWGRPMLTFNGIPIIRVDNLKPNEAVVS